MITGRGAPVYPAWNVDALDSSTEHGGSQSLVPLAIDEPSWQQTGSKRLESCRSTRWNRIARRPKNRM